MRKTSITVFISDLHLDENYPKIAQIFLQFLSELDPHHVDALYILGDLFEVWIGDDENTPFQQTITQALKNLALRGLPVYLLHGNRDFLIGQRFLQASGCQFIPDETVINLYGTPVLLMHGDTLCTRDIAYLKFRKKMRQPLRQKLFLCLPLAIRKKVAQQLRKKSKSHTASMNPDDMDVTQSEVDAVMQKHGVKTLIHGHTHKPAIHEFMINGEPATRLVLGAWHAQGHKLVWEASGHVLMSLVSSQ